MSPSRAMFSALPDPEVVDFYGLSMDQNFLPLVPDSVRSMDHQEEIRNMEERVILLLLIFSIILEEAVSIGVTTALSQPHFYGPSS